MYKNSDCKCFPKKRESDYKRFPEKSESDFKRFPEKRESDCKRFPEKRESDCKCFPVKREQEHVHEVQGSVKIAEPNTDPHNHRFVTVTDEAMTFCIRDHFHEIKFRTDFYEDHYHEFCGKTGGAIPVGDRHVHFLESVTDVSEGHRHEFRLSTFLNDLIGD